MKYPRIRTEGAIHSPDILNHFDDAAGPRPTASQTQAADAAAPAKKKREKLVGSNLDQSDLF